MSNTMTFTVPALLPRIELFAKLESIISPISILPPEILIEVFTYCVANAGLAPLTLRQVSWWWQELVDTSPRLWQTLLLGSGSGALSEQQAQLWMQRSRPLKCDIELNVDDSEFILPHISPLLPSIDRWRSFRLTGKRDEEHVLGGLDLTPEKLTHLHLFMHDYDQDDIDDDEPRITFTPSSPGQVFSFAVNLWVARLPSPTLLPPLHFVHVTIAEGGLSGLHTQPKYILEFLSACPELESFFLSGWPHDGPIDYPLPIIHLPNLVTLHLKNTCFVRALLSSLDTPRLEYLFLSHTNVDFQLHGEHHDEGDSEDEARDFSQSPWSDKATGMGLRKLINRSNPPIRVLEMDFCDMRTKDFRYVFDRLTFLEDFHIVASDMSDKVMGLLHPVKCQDGLVMHLRLPRLRRLRLTNCQRLGGKAIVDALTERVTWTDATCPNFTLVDVSIAECQGFSPWDRHLLSTSLGNRLRP
ncbi:hypothetical protein M413DRAFT_443939 [Hebeloma cylindrosporum]|uniref:F-box domain-containing protein n=1 Tax=Hebeloma cylindrosporum TaxID=76867 RepID=A0A0C3CG57_HEBCY|nr:hypothetical protein M413DRAFT_443939 [Hebeloma cylindrosporum h7]